MPLSSKAGQTQSKLDILENSKATITVKEQSGGRAEAEAHMLLFNAGHFLFPENTYSFTPLKLLRFNKAGNINVMLFVHDAVPLYFEITWANHRAPGWSQRANLYT